ncbi:MAG: uracil-DNA glycosylase [Promethearchaeota archaeon]
MDKRELLEGLNQQILKCKRCIEEKVRPLEEYGQYGLGWGNINSKMMFVAQNPGYHPKTFDYKKIIPFGLNRKELFASGAILKSALRILNISLDDFYITNIVKHSIKNNKPLLEQEIINCKCFLEKEIEIMKPKVIVTFGRFAKIGITMLGIKDIPVINTFHPSFVLRNRKLFDKFVNALYQAIKIVKE